MSVDASDVRACVETLPSTDVPRTRDSRRTIRSPSSSAAFENSSFPLVSSSVISASLRNAESSQELLNELRLKG